jgi:ABC-2 type transport system permease protein
VLLTLAFGVLVLGVDIDLAAIDWPLLVITLSLGLITLAIMGLALGGVTFLTAKHAMGINEGVAGIFYVLSGVIFPITILPAWAQSVSKLLPVTYWMEGVRRGLEPGVISELGSTTGLDGFSDVQLILTLVGTAVLFFFISVGIFRYADKVARRKGKIDWTSAY